VWVQFAVRLACVGVFLPVLASAETVTTSVPVGTRPYSEAINPLTNEIYVVNYTSMNVSVINGATAAVTATIAVGMSPEAVAVNPATNTVYVVNNGGGGTMSVINGFEASVPWLAPTDAAVPAPQIGYLNAQAPSTQLGDRAEVVAIDNAFGDRAHAHSSNQLEKNHDRPSPPRLLGWTVGFPTN
jgi:YVTN family beta-propeller protein